MKLTVRLSNMGVLAIIGLAVALLLAADILMRPHTVVAAPVATEKVVTKEFCLTDDSGRTRARIAMNEYGSPCLQLYDQQGQTRAQLRLNKDDVPSLRLYDANGQARSITGFTLDNMQPSVVMFDENGSGHLVASPASPPVNNRNICDEDAMRQRNSFSSNNYYLLPRDNYAPEQIHIDLRGNDFVIDNAQREAEQAKQRELQAKEAAEMRARWQSPASSGIFK